MDHAQQKGRTPVASILVIDDDEKICQLLATMIQGMGHHVSLAHTLEQGLDKALAHPFDVVFLDVMMPDGNGLDALPRIRSAPSAPEVIIITSQGNPDGAELAIRNGAWHYIEKPSPLEEITLPLIRALEYRREKAASKRSVALKREGIIGNSPVMAACLDLLARAATSEANVMITGETGTGKELFARAIHENSPRAGNNFVVVDCTILPETLVESMLFGHEKGSFTGADKPQMGLIKQADHGTLFLDEVGELPLSVQKAFLRVLEERRFRPLGAKHEVESDFRLVCATNRDLDGMARDGRFRKDLLFRLRSLVIELPPLRDRQEDLKDLVLYHMARICERYGCGTKGFSPDFFEFIEAYDWPGNVRELVLTLERTLAVAAGEPTVFPNHLPTHIRVHVARSCLARRASGGGAARCRAAAEGLPTLREAREVAVAEAERTYLTRLIESSGRNVSEACRISGLSRARLYALLKKYDLPRPQGLVASKRRGETMAA